MISISRQTDYASRVLLHLALLPPEARVTAREISRRRIIPPAFLRRIITDLGKAKLITTTRGSGGGLALARPSSEISLLDVVQAVEGPVALNPCTIDPAACPLVRTCPVHDEWMRARELLTNELSRATFDRLAQQGLAKQQRLGKEVTRRRSGPARPQPVRRV